jgi:hypothetical protein
LIAALAAAAALAAMLAGPAQAEIEPGFDSFTVEPSDTQAGGHPNVALDITYRFDPESCEVECLSARRLGFHWPEGFIGNPHVTPKCNIAEFSIQKCPSDAQIGYFTLVDLGNIFVPIYNMETRPSQAGLLGFKAPLISIPILIELFGRTDSDYGLDAVGTPLLRLPFNHLVITLFGVPADQANDPYRFITPLTGLGGCPLNVNEPGCPPGSAFGSPTFAPSTISPEPFLQNPTACGVPLTMTAFVEYFGGTIGTAEREWPETTGCQSAAFTPSIALKPTTASADTASGLDTLLRVPQTQSPITPSPSEVRATSIKLPEGFSINPGAADGKVACPDSLSAIGTLAAANCPEFSKVATLELDVAALPEPLPGDLYLAEPKPGEPYRVLLTASGFATNVKLLGRAETDPQTGQVTVIFDDLPQAPLQGLDLHVFGSERGLFATPSHCGVYPVVTEFVPWNTELTTRFLNTTITIDSGPNGSPCPVGARGLAPTVHAGVTNNTAGRHSPFAFKLDRGDGEQNLTGLTVSTPPGFAASLKGIPYCPEAALALLSDPAHSGKAEQASPACPAASRIGSAAAGAGAGTHPLYTPGSVYLAGPYKGGPLSLVVVVPALAGPYDLGNVAVRAAIQVDPVTARVTTISDPLPQILEGIPLRTRTILVNLDRPDFALNPTNCDPFSVDSSTTGAEGGTATNSVHFQVANCADLDFRPKLGLKLQGSAKRRGHPALRAVLRKTDGEANLRRAVTAMPRTLLLDNSHIGTVCTKVQFRANACPPASIYGRATVEVPILDDPLSGPVYLRSSSNKLPDLVVDLDGQFDAELSAKIDTTKGGGLRASFNATPDVPFTKAVIDLKGGVKGLLQNSADLCKARPKATAELVGQNGVRVARKVKLQTACRQSAKRSRHVRRLHRSRVVR